MKALILTSTGIRHKLFIDAISSHFQIVGIITEDKGSYYDKQSSESELVKEHFATLAKYEQSLLANHLKEHNNEQNMIYIPKGNINQDDIVNEALKLEPDVVLLFGTSILKSNWLRAFPDKIINLHLGLSPYYKGSATLFWPFLYDELECIGATIHIAEEKVDAGRILKRVKPDITAGDNYYTVNYKTIKKAIEVFSQTVLGFLSGDIVGEEQLTEKVVRVFKKSDFNEEALSTVLGKYKNTIGEQTVNMIKKSKRCSCCP